MNRLAFFISAVLTSFILVIAGALVGAMNNNEQAAAQPTVVQDVAAADMPVQQPQPMDVTVDPNAQVAATIEQSLMPAVETIIQQREAQYRQLLDEANRQLQAAYAKQQELANIAQQAQAAQAQAEQMAQQMAEQLAAVQAAQAQAQAQTANAAMSHPATTNTQPPAPQFAVTPAQAAGIAQSVANSAALVGQPELVLFEGTPAYEVPFDRGMVYVDANTGAILYNGLATPPPTHRDDDDEHEEHEEHDEHDEHDDDHEKKEKHDDHDDDHDDDHGDDHDDD